MAFQTSMNRLEMEEVTKLRAVHTSIVMGFITQNNNAYAAMLRILERAAPVKDPDVAIDAIKSYLADRMGQVIDIDKKLEHGPLTLNFINTGLNLVDWYAVLSLLQELKEADDNNQRPF